jgi:DNA-binding response OmpR family regulator
MNKNSHILLVESDANLNMVVADYLCSKAYTIDTAKDGQEAWDLISKRRYDIILTNINMPQINGYDLLKLVRSSFINLPIIVISDKKDKDSIIRAYELGCDDYIIKPFSIDILTYKIEAILRRCQAAKLKDNTTFDLAELQFDAARQTLGVQHLSTKENELLLMLCQNMNNLVERNYILMSLWGEDTYFNARSLSVYINHLRKYLGQNSPVKILSVHGKGYKLVIMNDHSDNKI